jgi:hypothetical protein
MNVPMLSYLSMFLIDDVPFNGLAHQCIIYSFVHRSKDSNAVADFAVGNKVGNNLLGKVFVPCGIYLFFWL